MSKIYRYSIAVIFFLTSLTFAQTYTISGKVNNSATGENLIGANVYIASLSLGAITNTDGFYTITKVAAGTYTIKVSYIGYEPIEEEINVTANMVLNYELTSTTVMLQDVVVAVNRGKDRETPATFTTVGEDELKNKYTTQDVPDLLKTVPGVFTTSNGLGEADILIRGFDAEHIQILINGVPTNDPESQVVYWSNWTGLSNNASSIQVQRGTGVSLMGSGAFGGSINIETGMYSSVPKVTLRGSTGLFVTKGRGGGGSQGRKNADGTGGFQNITPANQNFSFDYTSGQLYGGKLNIFLSYERKAGDSYVAGTYYNGHAWYVGLQSILGNHLLTLNAFGAPQRHNQARTSQDMDLLVSLGLEYNRNNTPYQENYYHKPQFDLHWDWNIGEQQNLNTNAFVTLGNGGGRYLRNDVFDVRSGEIRRKDVSYSTDNKYFGRHARFIYETTGEVLEGYNTADTTYTYAGITKYVSSSSNLITSSFNHSWRNDSQNNHTQFGINTAYTQRVVDWFGFTVGGEARNWNAEHTAQSFDLSYTDPNDEDVVAYFREAQRRYNYDGIVTNLAGFARLMLYPIPEVTIMLDGQYASYNSKVEETPIQVFDFGAGKFTETTYLSTVDLKDSDGYPLYTKDDYERTFNFFQPKAGLNWNINDNWNVYGNFGIAKKEPKVGDWYDRDDGPGANQPVDANGNIMELKEETLTNYEGGIGYYKSNARVTANFFYSKFEDKIESVTNQEGDRVTMNAGNATHYGLELAANVAYSGWDAYLSLSAGSNTWDEMNVSEIFGTDSADVVGKVVPFAPENIYHVGVGYSLTPQIRVGIDGTAWNRYYGNYDNTASLPNFFAINLVVEYAFFLSGARVDLRFNAYNINAREQFTNAAWTRDFNRTDDMAGKYFMNVMQSPMQHYFLTATVTIL